MKALKWIWNFVKKNFRWLFPALILFAFAIIQDKSFGMIFGFIAGAIFMAFIWYAYRHYIANKLI